MKIRSTVARFDRPDFWIGVDSAITAAASAILLIVGSRVLGSGGLVPLAMVQLFASSAVILQRATLLSPALAARRQLGAPAAIPTRWAWFSVPVFALPVAAICPFVMGASEAVFIAVPAAAAFGIAAVGLDFVRYMFISRDMPRYAVIMDIAWVGMLVIGGLIVIAQPSWLSFAYGWSVCGALACAVGAVIAIKAEGPKSRATVTLAGTLRLGRWSGLDNLLSVTANLVPMAVATLTIATPLAAVYRVLQTALGPLNIVNTTLMASFGLNSWRLTSVEALRDLRSRVKKSVMVLLAATILYVGLAFTIIILAAGISWSDSIRVVAVLFVAAILGAWTSPLAAASSALGYQFLGLIVRILVVTFSIFISWTVSAGVNAPIDDPIGAVALVAALLGILGWGVGYVLAMRREHRVLGSE